MSASRNLLLARCRMRLWLPAYASVAITIAGCTSPREVAVRVSIPGPDGAETPASGVGVVALPYDRDSVLASLEARAATPRPYTAQMDTLFAQFRGPFVAYTNSAFTAGKLRDSLNRVQRRLDSLERSDPEYPSLRKQRSQLTDSLRTLDGRNARARATLGRARSEFVRRSDTLRTAIRLWEDSTYRGWDSIVAKLAKDRGMEPSTDTTDATGWAHFKLAPGTWWIYARAWDTTDPNSEWYWNVAVDGDTVLLSSRTGHQRPRY